MKVNIHINERGAPAHLSNGYKKYGHRTNRSVSHVFHRPFVNHFKFNTRTAFTAYRKILTRKYKEQEADDSYPYGDTQMYPNEGASNAVQSIKLPKVHIPHPTIVPELVQPFEFQHSICTLDEVIALQETVVWNPGKYVQLLVACLSHWQQHTTKKSQQTLSNLA